MKKFHEWLEKVKVYFGIKSQEQLLDAADILEQHRIILKNYILISLIGLVLIALIIWAALSEVDEITRARGEVVPSNKIVHIQHPYGGVVRSIMVVDGEQVKENQALLDLRPTAVKAELEKNILKFASLVAQKISMKSNLKHSKIDSKMLMKAIKQEIQIPPEYDTSLNAFLQDSALLANLEKTTDQSEEDVLKQQIKQKEIEYSLMVEKIKMKKQLLSVMSEELEMYEKLKQKSLVSKRELLAMKRQYIILQNGLLEANKNLEKQKTILEESRKTLARTTNTNQLELAGKLNQINTELLQLRRTIIRLQDQYQNLVLRSPINGIVKGLNTTVGAVISSNETLMDIVPVNTQLVVEAKISSRDIGHIKLGSPVKLKISSYEYNRYGMINGKIKRLSAMTFLDPKTNATFYKGIISLDKTYIGNNPAKNHLIPGMTVEADIYTGKKTVLAYLLKPIYRTVHLSFSER